MRFALGGLLIAVGAAAAGAQCPDGSRPPCAVQAALPALDARRVAILPFRVTAADSLLGEGFAELVAMELADRADVRPVHMGSLLSAWRDAGGGLRSPLPIERATRVSRTLGAARLVEGSVIGTGSRLTIATSMVTVADGRSVPLQPVRGHVDSLEELGRRVSVAILAALGGEPSAAAAYRLTNSPVALLAYLDGLSAWRRRGYRHADASFERALDADSTFASAAFARLRSGSYNYQPTSRWANLALRYQHKLTTEERATLHALLGENYPARRTNAERLRALEELAQRYPESAEPLYHLADFLLHRGRPLGIPDFMRRAVELFDRSVRLDTQSTVFTHLLGGTMALGDTALLRRQWRAHEAFFRDSSDSRIGWIVRTLTRDSAGARRYLLPRTGFSFFMINLPQMGITAAQLDSMFAHSRRELPRSDATWLSYATGAFLQGRPAAAARALAQWQTTPASAIRRDALLIAAAVAADGDMRAADSAFARLETVKDPAAAETQRLACAKGIWSQFRGRDAAAAGSDAASPTGWTNCDVLIDVMRAARRGTLTVDALARADSQFRERVEVDEYVGIESTIMARAWNALGDTRRAFDAARRSHDGYPLNGGLGGAGTATAVATSALLEARLAARIGDSASAADAYRRYLMMRDAPEPALVPQRDSARAELARLTRP